MSGQDQTFDIGVIGAGQIASATHLPVLANVDWANISFVADIENDQLRTLGASYDTETVAIGDNLSTLPDCDIALLATPIGVREEYINEFGHRGTPVFVEKPFATSLDQHDRFVETLDTVYCNYLRLCFSPTHQLRRLVSNDLLGQLERVIISEGGIVGATGRSQSDYLTDPSLSGGGILVERGTHTLSQLLYVLDPNSIDVLDAEIVSDEEYDVDVNANLSIETSNQTVPVEFDLSRIRPLDNQFRIVFEHGSVSFAIDEPGAQLKLGDSDSQETVVTLDAEERWATTFAQAAYIRWRQFLSKLTADTEYSETLATGREITRLVETIYNDGEVTEL